MNVYRFTATEKKVRETVGQGLAVDAVGGMHHGAGWFVKHNEVGIFVENVEVKGFGCDCHRFASLPKETEAIARVQANAGPGDRTIDNDPPGHFEASDQRP